ncbi:MAG: DUF393 domain-containing protein [Boseongicola sp.]|nr:DUF393 domain-containing protein [Boseongicola sp.]NNL19129.1 DUF393 domain-containing protein [Boseongicola sp.]
MKHKSTVIFNGDCPICSREIEMYRGRVEAMDGTLGFVDLNAANLQAYGLSADQAARRLYVMRDGEMLAGVEAFLVLWRETPGFAWLARLVGLPVVRHVAHVVYEWGLAPLLFRMHKRRQARGVSGA